MLLPAVDGVFLGLPAGTGGGACCGGPPTGFRFFRSGRGGGGEVGVATEAGELEEADLRRVVLLVPKFPKKNVGADATLQLE